MDENTVVQIIVYDDYGLLRTPEQVGYETVGIEDLPLEEYALLGPYLLGFYPKFDISEFGLAKLWIFHLSRMSNLGSMALRTFSIFLSVSNCLDSSVSSL